MRTAGLLVTAAAALLGGALPAHAEPTVTAFSTMGTGITDKPRSAVGGQGSSGNALLALRAGLMLVLPTAQSFNRGFYLAGITYEPHESFGTSYLNQLLVWESEIEATERLWAGLGAFGASGLVNDDSTADFELQPIERLDSYGRDVRPVVNRGHRDPSGVDLGLVQPPTEEGVPPGLGHFYSGSLSESLSYALTERTYVSQSASADTFAALINDDLDYTTFIVANELELGYEWSERTGIRLGAEAGWQKQTESRFEPTFNPAGTGEFGRVTAGWGHYLTRGLMLDLMGGMFAARDNVTMDDFATGPTGRVTVRWVAHRLGASVQGDRGAYASPSLGGVFLRDRVVARARSRFGDNEMFQLNARVVHQQLSQLGRDRDMFPPIKQWIGRISLGIRPWEFKQIQMDVSYRLRKQIGGALGRRMLRDVERHTIMLSLTAGMTLMGPVESLPD